jgi:COMPASS component SPP1
MEATLPLSKYCSDWCGITVVAMRMEAQEGKRSINLDLLWEAVSGLEKQQATIEAIGHADYHPSSGLSGNDSRRIDHQMVTLRASLDSTVLKRTALERQLASIDQRIQYMHSAIQRSEELVAAHIAANPTASSKTKRSKTKTAAPAGAAGDAPCGFDVRLVWSDKDFNAWASTDAGRRALSLDEHNSGPVSEEEEGLVCMLAKRKCDRHTGWQKTKEADYEVEKAGLARRIDVFSDKERHLKRAIEDLRDTIRWREGRNGHRDGDDRTVGGADDMDVEITPYVETFEIPPTPGVALLTARA